MRFVHKNWIVRSLQRLNRSQIVSFKSDSVFLCMTLKYFGDIICTICERLTWTNFLYCTKYFFFHLNRFFLHRQKHSLSMQFEGHIDNPAESWIQFFRGIIFSSIQIKSFSFRNKEKNKIRNWISSCIILHKFSMWFSFSLDFVCTQVRCTVILWQSRVKEEFISAEWLNSTKRFIAQFVFVTLISTRKTFFFFDTLALSFESEFLVEFLLTKFIKTQWQIHLKYKLSSTKSDLFYI